MRKTLAAILCSALMVASSMQMATAAEHPAEHHKAHKTGLKPMANEQFRISYNEMLRDANPYEICGLFPGPCQ